MQDMWALNVSLESSVTPRYFVSFVHAMFSLKIFTGRVQSRKWRKRLENSVIVHLFVLTLILHLRSQGSNKAIAEFILPAAMSVLPDRTLIFVSSA
jgi:hypothetical protein